MVGQLLQKAFRHKLLRPRAIGHMHDQGVTGWTSLGRKDLGNGGIVIRAGGEAVDGFGRQAQQLASRQQACAFGDCGIARGIGGPQCGI